MQYAKNLLKKLDPEGKLQFKLYRRDCTYANKYVKDLSRLNRPLRNIIIIDVIVTSLYFLIKLNRTTWIPLSFNLKMPFEYPLITSKKKMKN